MDTLITVVLFALGIFFIVKGGDTFVDAASWIAEASGIPKFIIGATVVSFATTLPELLVSLIAAGQGKVDMSIGNAVGSVTANIGLIMGISVFVLPSVIKRATFAFKGVLMAAVCLVVTAFSLKGSFGILPSIILLAMFALYMYENVREAAKSIESNTGTSEKYTGKVIVRNAFKFVIGTAGIVAGAQLLVDKGSDIARLIGVPESIIGVTMIAIGTSLPELVTTITAIVKKESSLSIGNIIGANIIDLSLILPACSLVSGGSLPVADQSRFLDMPVCLLVILIAMVPALISEKMRRSQGLVLLLTYGAYLAVLCSGVFA